MKIVTSDVEVSDSLTGDEKDLCVPFMRIPAISHILETLKK